MVYHLEFRPYSFPLTTPLVTNHGSWEVRSGIILKLWEKRQDDCRDLGEDRDQNTYSKITYGEIAPIPWFGSETLEAALEFCQSLPSQITSHEIENIPDRLPATQFGFSSAVESLEFLKRSPNPLQKGALKIPLFIKGTLKNPLFSKSNALKIPPFLRGG
ncbi:MAG: hypothetical protein HC916_16280 [Coleofasciculaceae cyanobacterium SM2_1_6]|nr:hypothetical protein [Coleofasciculaceae cyanobacterium SM2_1_6]